MNTSERFRRLLALAVIISLLAGPVSAEKPKSAKRSAEKSDSAAAFAQYRDWKPVNAELIEAPAALITLCAPRRAVDPNGPHAGGFINVYVNAIGRDEYLSERSPAFAEGTVIVKEKLKAKDAKGPVELGVMINREAGYAPDAGDWQYVFVDHKGSLTEKQSKLNCAKCHQIQAENDCVYRRMPMVPKGTSRSATE